MNAWVGELPRPIAFVLAGGASLGSIQVGQLRALIEWGIEPDFLSSASVGSINGTFMARDFSESTLDELEQIWLDIDRDDIFPGIGAGSLLRTLSPWNRGHLASTSGLERLFESHLPRSHADLQKKVLVMATDVVSGEKVSLTSGALHEHVMASAAIPLVFPPVEIDGRLLVDGGVVANVPVLPAADEGAKTLVVLDPGYPCAVTELPDSKLGYLLHLTMLSIRHQSWGVLHFLRERPDTTVLYLPPPCPIAVLPHDFSQTPQLMQRGYDNSVSFLEEIDWKGNAIYGHPHIH